jgi:hypothetical protein
MNRGPAMRLSYFQGAFIIMSTGPRTAEGKAISSRNAVTHGLTAKSPLLPSEDPAEYRAFVDAQLRRWNPETPDFHAAVLEFADVSWRLNRAASQEAKLVSLELLRMQIERRTDHALDQLLNAIGTHDQETLEALAVNRLFQSRTLVNLHRQENRLERRLRRLREELRHFVYLAGMRRRAQEREALEEAEIVQQNELSQSPAAVIEIPLRV